MLTALLAFTVNLNAQIKNAKTETITIYGNCGMCENNIETAGNVKKVAVVDWDKASKLATLTYDSKKTNTDEILKRIALAGYDSDKFLAPDDVYDNLHGCCQYDRTAKVSSIKTESLTDHNDHQESTKMTNQKQDVLKSVFDNYFEIKDALVNSDAASAASKASTLLTSVANVEMDQLDTKVHMVWMKVFAQINADTKTIAGTKDLAKQRKHFMTLSKDMYSLMKIANHDDAVYFQHCPMANEGKGADWLSKDKNIKNPYYGSAMMSCGKTMETLK